MSLAPARTRLAFSHKVAHALLNMLFGYGVLNIILTSTAASFAGSQHFVLTETALLRIFLRQNKTSFNRLFLA